MLDAKDRGMNENQCKLYGGIMGVVEGATGALTFGNSKIAGKTIGELLKGGGVQGAKNIAKQTSKEIAKKETLRTGGKALLINAMEEGFQEGITEPIQELTAGWIGGKDKANWENMPSRILSSAAAGAFSSTIVGGANIGVYSCMDINAKISNGETVTQQELVKAYKDASKKLDTKKIMDDTVKQYQTIIQNQTQNENMTPNQQITQQQNNLSQNQSSEQIKAKETLKQEIQNSNLSSKEKTNMMDYVNNNNIEQNTYNNMRETIGNANNTIENNKEILYNNSNERESEINGYNKNEQRRIENIYQQEDGGEQGQGGNTINTSTAESIMGSQNKDDAEAHYRKFEQEAIKNQLTNISKESQQVKKIAKEIYNKDIIHFDDEKTLFGGGLSKIDNTSTFFGKNAVNNYGDTFLLGHEIGEDMLKNHKDKVENTYNAFKEKIQNDDNFGNIFLDYIFDMDEELKNIYIEHPEAVAKELICDTLGFMQNDNELGNNLPHKDIQDVWINNLNPNLVNEMKQTLKQFHDEIYLNNKVEQSKKIENDITGGRKAPTRHDVIQNNRKIARENIKNIANWKDKSSGIRYQLETMERNMYDIIPDKKEAKKMIDTYFEPVHEQEAEKQRFINKYNDRIKEFNLNKYESEAVQLLGEQKYNPSFKQEDVNDLLTKVNQNIENGKINKEKVNKAIETFREIYDELFEIENNVLKKNGYKEKPYRKGYFPHFIDYVPETKIEKALNKLGFKIDKRPLPTDIAGITEQFVPGKTWNKSALERKGNKTDYNALKGFDTYIIQASDNIFHTDNIQRLRGLENEIRYQYSDKGVQERIDNILNDETLFEEEKQSLLDEILEQVDNPMPNLVTELRRYTNALANKKSEADRSIENAVGRSIYSTVNAIENRFGANAVGLNIGSAITNFIPITQAYSQVSTKNMGRAILDTVKSYAKDDGFVNKSTFLTNRLNQSEKLYKTTLEKISDKTSFLFNAIDEVTSNIVVRGKYLDNIQNGMSEIEAIKDADRFGANVIADRSKGALPTKFEEKNPLTKMFTQFQLEVNNQYRYMFKDIPRDLAEKGLGTIALAFLKMFVGAWLYNEASEKITGRKPAFSPIDLITSSYKTATNDELTTANKIINISKEYAQQSPFVGNLVGGGRVPVNGAIPDIDNVVNAGVGLATGEMDSKKAINTLWKEASKPAYYLLPPFGGGQIKKSIEGIETVKKGGSYGIDSNGKETLQFPVENPTAKDYIKAGLFGKYALPEAKTYTDNEYKSLNAKDTKGYKDVKLPYKEFTTYTNSKLKKKEEKIDYINKMNITEQQKWGMYCYDIFDDTTRKSDNGSQLEDAKYAITNGTSKGDYINLYDETSKRNMNMPTKEENEQLKKEGISLKNYVDYTIKVHDETKSQKKSGQLKENQQLKNKDKIKIILNSNYSNKEKEAIYKKSINSEDKKIELVDKLGFPLTEYLKYKQQDFKNDKDVDGETISGSKKQKVVNYLVNIPNSQLSMDYKKIICKIEGVSNISGVQNLDSDIVRFINSKNLSVENKKDLLESIGFDVYKYGNVKSAIMLPIKKSVK